MRTDALHHLKTSASTKNILNAQTSNITSTATISTTISDNSINYQSLNMSHYFALPLHSQMPSRKQHIDPFLSALLSSLQQTPNEQPVRPTEQEPVKPAKPVERQTNTTTRCPVFAASKCPVSAPAKPVRTFTPRFDAYETETSYHLHGEFPGLSNKKAINIEFSDLNSITISGTVDRAEPITVASKSSVDKEIEEPEVEVVEEKTKEQEEDKDDAKSVRSLQPYVEDTEDEDDISIVSSARSRRSSAGSRPVSPTTKPEEEKVVEKAVEKVVEKEDKSEDAKEEKGYKAWINERKFGDFQRTFSFPAPVELDEVTAKLENGLLTIVVPKKKFVGRKVLIE
jgi:HSP20 family protein